MLLRLTASLLLLALPVWAQGARTLAPIPVEQPAERTCREVREAVRCFALLPHVPHDVYYLDPPVTIRAILMGTISREVPRSRCGLPHLYPASPAWRSASDAMVGVVYGAGAGGGESADNHAERAYAACVHAMGVRKINAWVGQKRRRLRK